MHVGLGRQLKEAKVILAEEDVPIDFPSPCAQELSEEIFPGVVLLATLVVRKCHGFKRQIIRKKLPAPKRFVFFMQAL